MRKPTMKDFLAFAGSCSPGNWRRVPNDWSCPACGRTKFETLRWLYDKARWTSDIHEHHDHSTSIRAPNFAKRFENTLICNLCNSADGNVKRYWYRKIPESWSFSPDEIKRFVKATPHGKHIIDFEKALKIFQEESRKKREMCGLSQFM